MICPFCGVDLGAYIDEKDKMHLETRSNVFILSVFLDYFINQNHYNDFDFIEINAVDDKTYDFKIPVGWVGNEIDYAVGRAVFYFDPETTPNLKFKTLSRKDIVEKVDLEVDKNG